MKKKNEKVYFNELWDKMKAHLKAFTEGGDQEQLHQFRVQVKKLRAMFILFDAIDPKHPLLKDFKPIRIIFKHAGGIRDAYIHLQLGVHYKLNNQEFIDNQQKVIDDGIGQLKDNRAKNVKTIKKTHVLLEDGLKPVRNNDIVDFYVDWLNRIAADISTLEFNDTLHSCRRQIKILLYNFKFTHTALKDKLDINTDYLDKLQESIGKWHDNDLAIQLFLTEKGVVSKLKAQNTRQKKVIAALAADFWTKATSIEGVVVNN